MSFELPPIVKLAHRVRLDIEQAVRRFSRYHKYAIGADLRRQASEVLRIANHAWRDRENQLAHADRLSFAIDDLRFSAQLAKDDRAFASFGQFELIANALHELGQQCGGWQRELRRRSQNAAIDRSSPQRAQILSAHGAQPSSGANL
jgi:hypothetical protein